MRAGDFVATIPVAWSKPPASIVFEGATSLKLGELHPDQPVQRTLTLRNAGEQKARVRVTAKDAWIFLPAGGTVFDLRPGQTKTIAVGGIGGGAAGERRGTLVAAWESGTSEVSVGHRSGSDHAAAVSNLRLKLKRVDRSTRKAHPA